MSKNQILIPKRRFKGFSGEWKTRLLGEFLNVTTGKLDANAMVMNGKYDFYTSGIEKFKINTYAFSGPAITVAGNGATVGYLHLVDGKFNAYQRTYVLTNFLLDRYFVFYLLTKKLPKKITFEVRSGNIPYIVKNMLTYMMIQTPKQIPEQTKIGKFFENLDEKISFQKQKIDKLKDLKKSYLNKMFLKESEVIPELRFEEFSDEWEEQKLGNIGKTFSGLTGKNKESFGHGTAKYITYMNVFKNSIADINLIDSIEKDEKQNEVMYGDILFTISSETPEEVGLSSVWLASRANIYLNSFCFGYRLIQDLDSYYMAYMLRAPHARKRIIILAQGISRYNISKTKVMEMFVSFPSLSEQTKIGNFFQKLDNLISLNEVKLNKLKDLKKSYLNEMFVNN